jgi:hypothetical protein
VATGLNLTAGTTYEITLQGAQRWVRTARVVSVLPGAMVLEFDDGRQVRIPRDAIIAARPLTGSGPSPASGVTSARGSLLANAPGRVAAPGAGPAVSLPVNPESFYFTYINEKGSDVSAAWLLDLRTRLVKETGGPSPVLRAAIADALDAVARQLLENEFERHESAHGLACQAIAAGTAALDDAAGRDWVPPAYFRTLLRQLTYVVGTEHTRYLRDAVSSPDFVSLAAREHYYVGDDQTFLLTVSVRLPPGDPPVESVQLVVGQSPGLRALGTTGFVQTLRSGETRELVQRLRVSDLALGVGVATISLSLRYRCTSGQVEESPARAMVAVLEPARKFVSVANPYSRYSGGIPVEEQKMFFGRQELLGRIHTEVTTGPLGQCFVLYGQKRSGKSSVLRQLTNRLRPPALAVYLPAGHRGRGRRRLDVRGRGRLDVPAPDGVRADQGHGGTVPRAGGRRPGHRLEVRGGAPVPVRGRVLPHGRARDDRHRAGHPSRPHHLLHEPGRLHARRGAVGTASAAGLGAGGRRGRGAQRAGAAVRADRRQRRGVVVGVRGVPALALITGNCVYGPALT